MGHLHSPSGWSLQGRPEVSHKAELVALLLAERLGSQPFLVVVGQLWVGVWWVPARRLKVPELLQEQFDVAESQWAPSSLPNEPFVKRDLLTQLLEPLRSWREVGRLLLQGPELVRS